MALAVHAFDEGGLESAVEEAFASLGIAGTLRDVVLPYLKRLGDEWAGGTVSVAHEHFASQTIRRLVGQRAGPPPLSGRPLAVLATPPGERHDLGLLCFALLLGQTGWATRFIGADTPMASLHVSCQSMRPDAVVLSATRESVFLSRAGGLGRLAREWPLLLGGRGATQAVVDELGAQALPADIVAAVPCPGACRHREASPEGRSQHSDRDVRSPSAGRVGGCVVGHGLAGPLGLDRRGSAPPPVARAPRPSRGPAPQRGRLLAAADAAVPGLDRDPGAAGQHVVEVPGALVRGRVDDLGPQVVVRARRAARRARVARRRGRAPRRCSEP